MQAPPPPQPRPQSLDLLAIRGTQAHSEDGADGTHTTSHGKTGSKVLIFLFVTDAQRAKILAVKLGKQKGFVAERAPQGPGWF